MALSSAGSAAGQSPNAPAAPADLHCALRVPARATSGRPVPLRLTIANRGRSGVYLLVWGTPFEGWLAPFVDVRHEGAEVPYRGPSVKRADPDRKEYLHLAPGRSRSATVDLAEAFDLQRPGHYRIEPRIVLHDVFNDGEGRPPRPRAEHQGQPLACEPLAFEVEAPRP